MYEPPIARSRRSIRSQEHRLKTEEKNYSKNNLYTEKLHMENTHLVQSEGSFSDDDNIEYEKEKIDQNEINKKKQFHHLQNRSRTVPPEKTSIPSKKARCSATTVQSPQIKKAAKSKRCYLIIFVIIISVILLFLKMYTPQSMNNNDHNLLFKFIKDVKAKFHNQESDSWNDISSAINEVISRSPKVPSIILLFANETSTMDCLATELAHVSSVILHTNHPKNFNPKNFGNNAGEIINTVKEYFPPVKVMVIRDILNINAEAIKALHFLCDRVSPLIDEAIYILTMQTNNYQPSVKRLTFVEEHIRRKLSKSIDQDILMPLITRITDGAIISVQPEQNLEHCKELGQINLSEL